MTGDEIASQVIINLKKSSSNTLTLQGKENIANSSNSKKLHINFTDIESSQAGESILVTATQLKHDNNDFECFVSASLFTEK